MALVARYELCRERIKKLLLNKGFSPAAAEEIEINHSPGDNDNDNGNEPVKPRKVCRVGPAGFFPSQDLSCCVGSGNYCSVWTDCYRR